MSKLDNLMIARNTKVAVSQYLKDPTHALLVIGSKGSGVDEVVTALGLERLKLTEKLQLNNTPRALVIKPNKNGNISIDEIREVWKFAKVSGSKGTDKTKLVLIYDAHALTTEAQNSLLKLLEEPPEYLNFILSAPSTRSVLSTIDSRTTKLIIQGVSRDEFSKMLVSSGVDSAEVERLRFVSGGEVYKALSLSKLNSEEGLGLSKELIAKKPYQRLVMTKAAMNDRAKAIEIANNLYHLSFIGLKTAISSGKSGEKWLEILKKAELTATNLEANGNVRLNLTSLLVGI